MSFQKYLPFEKFVITSKLSSEEVMKRLTDNLEPKRKGIGSYFNIKSSKPYFGVLTENKFEIHRIINYRNSFLPQIKGTVSSYLGETEISIYMRPAKVVIGFMIFWLGIVGVICMAIIINLLQRLNEIMNHKITPGAFIPFIMFVFGYLLIYFGFKVESKKSKAFLINLFEGTVKR